MIIIIQLVVLTLPFEERLDVSEKLAAACFVLMASYEIGGFHPFTGHEDP